MRAARAAAADAFRVAAAFAEDGGCTGDEGALEANARARAPRAARPAAAEDTAEPPWVHVFARQPSTGGGNHRCGARDAADGAPCVAAAATTRRAPCLSMPRGTCSAAKWRWEGHRRSSVITRRAHRNVGSRKLDEISTARRLRGFSVGDARRASVAQPRSRRHIITARGRVEPHLRALHAWRWRWRRHVRTRAPLRARQTSRAPPSPRATRHSR